MNLRLNVRLTIAAAVAVLLASFSEFQVTGGFAWLAVTAGAIACVALAGPLTRLEALHAAAGATALAALALVPTISSPHLWVKLAGLLVVAVCAASARGARPLRFAAAAVTYLAALFLYLNAILAGPQSWARVIPDAASVRELITLAGQGTALTSSVPPVPDVRGLQLLLGAGIGLVAILTDVLAVRLRHAALAGLPLAIVFLAPTVTAAKLGGPAGTIEFLLAAAGYLSLLSADGRARTASWGRVVTIWQNSGGGQRPVGVELGRLASTGRRIGLAAVTVAVFVPLALPAVQLLKSHRGKGGGPVVEVALPDPLVRLQGLLSQRSPQPVLTYRTTSADPASDYLQVYVLDFDPAGNVWRLINPGHGVPVGTGPLPVPSEVQAGTPEQAVTTSITLDELDGFTWPVHFLPVPYWPAELRIAGSWQEDPQTQMIYSGVTPLARLGYTVTSEAPDPSAALLSAPQFIPASIARQYLGYATPVTAKLRALAQRIVAGQRSTYAEALALEHWFLTPGRFTYTLSPNLPGTPAGLLRFLTTSRRGYCQQFAFAFAVLARLLDIPSRIAVGFTAGTRQPNGTWLVTSADAHSWPELYFTGIGWLRFEPTPGGAGGQGTAVVPTYANASPPAPAGQGAVAVPSILPSPGPSQGLKGPLNPHVKQPGAGTSSPAPAGGVPLAAWIAIACVGAAICLLLAAPGLIRIRTRRGRWRKAIGSGTIGAGAAGASDIGTSAAAVAAWLELSDTLVDFGLRYLPSDSPRAVARTVLTATSGDPEVRAAIGRLTSAVEQAFYGPAAPSQIAPDSDHRGLDRGVDRDRQARHAIWSDLVIVRQALARSVSRAARWRAAILPGSIVIPIRRRVRFLVGLADETPELTELSPWQERDALRQARSLEGVSGQGQAASG